MLQPSSRPGNRRDRRARTKFVSLLLQPSMLCTVYAPAELTAQPSSFVDRPDAALHFRSTACSGPSSSIGRSPVCRRRSLSSTRVGKVRVVSPNTSFGSLSSIGPTPPSSVSRSYKFFSFVRARPATTTLSFGNDPSAGSPTETLLRLLLPLSARVRSPFRPAPTGGRMPARVRRSIDRTTSLERSIGSSDGRCVQRAGTQSARDDDSRLLGIPGSREILSSLCPDYDRVSFGFTSLSARGPSRGGRARTRPRTRPTALRRSGPLAAPTIVARVRPRTSKGITDLLSLDLVRLNRRRSF